MTRREFFAMTLCYSAVPVIGHAMIFDTIRYLAVWLLLTAALLAWPRARA